MKDAILKELNPEQRKAVTTLDGPILVVAGAGTGKTKLITHRIAYMIKKMPDLSPSNFLAVSFSKKAAEEMLLRVESLIGEHKDELWISTFHSFCHRLLKDHALDIGLSRNYRLLDRTGQWIFFKKIIPDLKLKYYLNLADPFSPINDFIRFISRCKDELISPEDYLKYVNSLPDSDEDKARQKEVARVYSKYQKGMQNAGCLDFGDLINYTISLFRKRPSILSKYQDQFHYILVDEFQDTNIAQIELVSMLAAKRKNICVVGDDDQGIYRFRGASYASFVKFKQKFPDLTSLKLTQNYRSTKKILSLCEALIKNNNPDRYDPQKNLWTGNKSGTDVNVITTNDYDSESQIVANKIKEICKKETGYSDVAILYRAHSHNQEIIKRLKLEGIPYNVVGPTGLFEREEIKDIVAILSALNDADDSISLFRMLTMPVFRIDLSAVIELNRTARKEGKSLYNIISGRPELAEFKNALKHLISLSSKVDIEKLFYEVIEKTGYVKDMLVELNKENEIKLSNIGKFYRLINSYMQEHEDIMLPAFMQYLRSYIEAGGDVAPDTEIIKSKGGVQLMTVHQAKGLEFPCVFVISLVQNRFPTRARPEAIPFSVDLMKEELPKGNFHIQEERRLFYVAITRAQSALFISTVKKPYHKKSVFLNELFTDESKGAIKAASIEYDKDKLTYESRFNLSKKDLISVAAKRRILEAIKTLEKTDTLDNDLIEKGLKNVEKEYYRLAESLSNMQRERLKEHIPLAETLIPLPADLKLSYTQLDTFLNCPLKYKFNYVYSIPIRPVAPLRFGADMHDTLEEFYKLIKKSKTPSLDELLKIYLARWNSSGYVNKSQEMQYQKNGLEMLRRFYKTNEEHFYPPLYVEEEFLVEVGDSQFKGFIDRVDELPDGGVEVIDYKTGTPKDQKFTDKSIQLHLYAIACQEVLNLEPRLLSFYFLTSNEKVSAICSHENIDETRAFIADTVKKIKSHHFEPNPGRRCRWCDYRIICPAAKL